MADKQKYQVNTPVYGNLAYDLDALVRERQLEEAGRIQKQQERTQSRPRTVARPREKVSLLALGSVVVLVAMAIGLLLGYVQLNRISTSVSQIKSELNQLNNEHVSLLTKYEQTYDLATIKEAAEKNGMGKPTSGQIEYIDMGGPDAAMVYHAGGETAITRLLQSVERGWQLAVEYFS